MQVFYNDIGLFSRILTSEGASNSSTSRTFISLDGLPVKLSIIYRWYPTIYELNIGLECKLTMIPEQIRRAFKSPKTKDTVAERTWQWRKNLMVHVIET